jgi:hypothetical protein
MNESMAPKQAGKKIQVVVTLEAFRLLEDLAKRDTRTVSSYVRHYLNQHLGIAGSQD